MATLSKLARACGGHIDGANENYEITEVSSLEFASEQSIAPYYNHKYVSQLENTKAGVILCRNLPEGYQGRTLQVDDPQLALTKLMPLLYARKTGFTGVECSAVIASDVVLPLDCEIGHNVVIETGAKVASGVRIKAGSYIGESVSIGADSCIGPNSTIQADSQLGRGVAISSGVVIGSDGFGYVPSNEQGSPFWAKVMHVGKVVIGNNVEIGANTAIDRGSVCDTIIGDDVIIDNLVQVAHNVTIGRATAIAACSAIAGSTHIGEECLIGGRVAIAGHINICDNTTIYADSLVTKSITKAGIYSSSLPAQPLKLWHRTIANLRRYGLKEKDNQSNKVDKN